MEVTEHYDNLAERADKIALREGQGLRMLHDNFDPDWKRGDEPHGTMIFTDEPALVSQVEPRRNLGAELDELKVKVQALEKRTV